MRWWRAVIALATAACGGARAPDLTVVVDVAHPGARIPDDFLGASYETSTLIGGAYFRADNATLLATFAQLGLHHLRLGGNEADTGPEPSASDIGAMLAFADSAQLPVIYTLRLATYDPADASSVARTMLDADASRLECFSIGNEPDHYLSYADYRTEATAYMDAIADPRAHYCGPDALPATYVSSFATDFAPRGDIADVTVHEYFGGGGQGIAPDAARDLLLSPALLDSYETTRASWAPAVAAAGLPYRIDETNSFANGGAPGASDTFASALWGLDYLHWWAAAGADGIDFHTGDHVSGATTTYPMFVTSSAGYAVRPLGYGVKAFDLGGQGRTVPVTLDPSSLDVTAYAVLADDGSITITMIDKRHDPSDAPISVAIDGTSSTDGQAWWLVAPSVDATTVTLGHASIAGDASWPGVSDPISTTFVLPPSSAVVARFLR